MGLREQTGGTGDRWEGQGIHSFVYSNSVHQAPVYLYTVLRPREVEWEDIHSQVKETDK